MKALIAMALAVAAMAPAHAAEPVSIIPTCEREKLVRIAIGAEQINYPPSRFTMGGYSTEAMKVRIKAALGDIKTPIIFNLTAGQTFSCISGLDIELEDMGYRDRQYEEAVRAAS